MRRTCFLGQRTTVLDWLNRHDDGQLVEASSDDAADSDRSGSEHGKTGRRRMDSHVRCGQLDAHCWSSEMGPIGSVHWQEVVHQGAKARLEAACVGRVLCQSVDIRTSDSTFNNQPTCKCARNFAGDILVDFNEGADAAHANVRKAALSKKPALTGRPSLSLSAGD